MLPSLSPQSLMATRGVIEGRSLKQGDIAQILNFASTLPAR